MKKVIYKQSGYYNKYPTEFTEIWEEGELIPSWLSDMSRVVKIEDNGQPVLDYIITNTGSKEIRNQLGGILVELPKNGVLIYSKTHGIQGLTKKQLELLYIKKEIKRED